MNRRKIREHIFKMLFRVEFHTLEEMPEQYRKYLDYVSAEGTQDSREYIEKKQQDIMDRLEEIDGIINRQARGWSTERMGKVELTIIRLAVYEMKFDEDIPVGVAINEAIELAKQFGGDDAPAFVNGVLAKIA